MSADTATPESRERDAVRGVRYSSLLVAAHLDGQSSAENLIRALRSSNCRGDELMAAAIEIADRAKTHEGRARARGWFRACQKAIEQVPQ